jgi:hypothetical protein
MLELLLRCSAVSSSAFDLDGISFWKMSSCVTSSGLPSVPIRLLDSAGVIESCGSGSIASGQPRGGTSSSSAQKPCLVGTAQGLAAVLDLEVAGEYRTPAPSRRGQGSHRPDLARQPPLGLRAYPRGVVEALYIQSEARQRVSMYRQWERSSKTVRGLGEPTLHSRDRLPR